jgi:general secretion pathway protein A
VWWRHWGLARDPFASLNSTYVALSGHDEALAHLVYAIQTAQPFVVLTGQGGLGKTTVLRHALKAASSPLRRVALVSCPPDEALLLSSLAERLAEPIGREPTRLAALKALDRACRVAGLQRCQVVLAIDHCDEIGLADLRPQIAALASLTTSATAGLTVIQVGRARPLDRRDAIDGDALVIGLEPLTRSQAERLLTRKLEDAGADAGIFTPRAITRLHGWSNGVPRGLEQLARFTLTAGAARRVEAITPELVDEVAANGGHVPTLAPRSVCAAGFAHSAVRPPMQESPFGAADGGPA